MSLGEEVGGRRERAGTERGLREPVFGYAALDHSGQTTFPAPFVLRQLTFNGVPGDSTQSLRHLYADLLGRRVDRAALLDVVQRISHHNAAAGFPARVAYIAEQDFQNGRVNISVSSGDVGVIEFVGNEGRTMDYVRSLASMLTEERPLRLETLTRFNRLADNVPGVSCTVEIAPPAHPQQQARLIITVKHDRATANIRFDNRAPRFIGRKVVATRVKLRGLASGTDELDARLIANTGRGDAYLLIASYATVLNAKGLTAELGVFRSDIKPLLFGPSPPKLNRINQNYEFLLSQPIFLSKRLQLSANGGFAFLKTERFLDDVQQTRDRRRATILGLELDALDPWGGENYVSLTWLRGWDVFGATMRGSPGASRLGDGAGFSTFILEAERVQKLGQFAELNLATWSQVSTRALFEVDQCIYGGRDFGLGHEIETLYGDHCFLGFLELRARPIKLPGTGASAAPYAFVDGGVVGFTGIPDAGALPTGALMSAGGGVHVKLNKYASARVEANWPLRRSGIDFSASDERLFFRLEANF